MCLGVSICPLSGRWHQDLTGSALWSQDAILWRGKRIFQRIFQAETKKHKASNAGFTPCTDTPLLTSLLPLYPWGETLSPSKGHCNTIQLKWRLLNKTLETWKIRINVNFRNAACPKGSAVECTLLFKTNRHGQRRLTSKILICIINDLIFHKYLVCFAQIRCTVAGYCICKWLLTLAVTWLLASQQANDYFICSSSGNKTLSSKRGQLCDMQFANFQILSESLRQCVIVLGHRFSVWRLSKHKNGTTRPVI